MPSVCISMIKTLEELIHAHTVIIPRVGLGGEGGLCMWIRVNRKHCGCCYYLITSPCCIALHRAIKQNPQSSPFLEPVRLDVYPDYIDYVKKPMDVGTAWKKCEDGCYSHESELAADLFLIVENCHLYCDSRFPELPQLCDQVCVCCRYAALHVYIGAIIMLIALKEQPSLYLYMPAA